MKKMIDVIKKREPTNRDIKQRIFVFFLTRVMLIRLNTQTLTEALRKLWPHLLSELISVFETRSNDLEPNGQPMNKLGIDRETADLTIEAIKLVELLSSLNIEDFQMNQWIFLIDGYGMRREDEGNSFGSANRQVEANRMMKRATSSKAASSDYGVSEVFRTFIVHFMGDVTYSFYNVEQDRHAIEEE